MSKEENKYQEGLIGSGTGQAPTDEVAEGVPVTGAYVGGAQFGQPQGYSQSMMNQ